MPDFVETDRQREADNDDENAKHIEKDGFHALRVTR